MPNQAAALADPFLIDIDRLHQLAAEAVVRDGLDDFKDKRVTEVAREADRLFAEVEDAPSEALLSLSIGLNEAGFPQVECPCQDHAGLCRHAIAALFAYAAGQEGRAGLRGAQESALAERRERGRTEVRVRKRTASPGSAPGRRAPSARRRTIRATTGCICVRSPGARITATARTSPSTSSAPVSP